MCVIGGRVLIAATTAAGSWSLQLQSLVVVVVEIEWELNHDCMKNYTNVNIISTKSSPGLGFTLTTLRTFLIRKLNIGSQSNK